MLTPPFTPFRCSERENSRVRLRSIECVRVALLRNAKEERKGKERRWASNIHDRETERRWIVGDRDWVLVISDQYAVNSFRAWIGVTSVVYSGWQFRRAIERTKLPFYERSNYLPGHSFSSPSAGLITFSRRGEMQLWSGFRTYHAEAIRNGFSKSEEINAASFSKNALLRIQIQRNCGIFSSFLFSLKFL